MSYYFGFPSRNASNRTIEEVLTEDIEEVCADMDKEVVVAVYKDSVEVMIYGPGNNDDFSVEFKINSSGVVANNSGDLDMNNNSNNNSNNNVVQYKSAVLNLLDLTGEIQDVLQGYVVRRETGATGGFRRVRKTHRSRGRSRKNGRSRKTRRR